MKNQKNKNTNQRLRRTKADADIENSKDGCFHFSVSKWFANITEYYARKHWAGKHSLCQARQD